MTREEHLQWCKDRALEYLDRGQISQAVTSMLSGLREHPETAEHPALVLMAMSLFSGNLNTEEAARRMILGFR